MLKGTVKDAQNNATLEGALVYIHESGNHALTDSKGMYILTGIRTGNYHLHVEQYGYQAWSGMVKVDSSVTEFNTFLKPSPIELKQVVIGGEELKTGEQKFTQPVEVADKEFLEKNYGNTFSETLEEIPGINALNTGVGISKPVIRGMTFNRVIVNDQGIKQEGQQWGLEHGLEIDQFAVQNVEIIKGPASYIYGSDGIGGVINILPPSLPQQKNVSGEVLSVYRNNNNLLGLSSMIEGRTTQNWFRARYSHQEYGDYSVPADSFDYLGFTLPIADHSLKNTAGRINNFTLSSGKVSNWGKITATGSIFRQKAGFFSGAIGIPRADDLKPDESTRDIDLPYQQINHYKFILNSEIALGNHWLETDLGYQLNIREEHSPPHIHIPNAPTPDSDLAHRWDLHTFSFNTRYHQSIGDSIKIVTGFSFQGQKNNRKGFEFLLPEFSSLNPGIYGFLQYDLQKSLTLNAGLRADLYNVNTRKHLQPVYNSDTTLIAYDLRAPELSRSYFNWSGGVGLSWYPNERVNVKINAGKSFRVPTAAELTVNGVHHGSFRHEKGSAELSPESGYQFDLVLSKEYKKVLIKSTPFFNYFKNYIFLRPTVEFSPLPDAGQIYQYSQSEVIHSGYELMAEYHPVKKLHLSFTSEYVYTYNINTSLPLPFIPPLSLKAEVEQSYTGKKKLTKEGFFGLETNYFAGQYRTDRNEKPTPGYFLVNILSKHEISVLKQEIQVFFRINNLFDVRYLKHLSRYRLLNLPEPGRNFIVTVKIPIENSKKNN